MTLPSITFFLEQPLVTFLTGKLIESGTGGDKTKEVAKAQEVIAVAAALTQINAGQTAGGIAALQSALKTTVTDPADALALSQILSYLSIQGTALQATLGGTLLGQAQTAILSSVLNTVTATAQAYIPAG